MANTERKGDEETRTGALWKEGAPGVVMVLWDPDFVVPCCPQVYSATLAARRAGNPLRVFAR